MGNVGDPATFVVGDMVILPGAGTGSMVSGVGAGGEDCWPDSKDGLKTVTLFAPSNAPLATFELIEVVNMLVLTNVVVLLWPAILIIELG